MVLRNYQNDVALNTLYPINLAVTSGLGETLKPRITSIGGTVTAYGSEKEPTGLTLANIATKMAVIKTSIAIDAFESLPNYICLVQDSGTVTELVLTSIDPESAGIVIS